MGNITLLDLLGAALISGFLLVMVYHSNARMNETLFTTGNDLVVQEQLVNLVQIIEKDVRRIGYCKNQMKIPDPSKAVISAGTNSFTFQTDVDDDGNVDTLSYYRGTVAEQTGTPNPRDMMLYRKLNQYQPLAMNIGLTRFDLKYFDINDDSLNSPVADPTQINNVEIAIQLESSVPYDTIYSYVAWRQMRMRTRNLTGR